MTYSIIAFDPTTGKHGIAVASKVLAIGARVPDGRTNAGIVATQALINRYYADQAVEFMRDRYHPDAILNYFLSTDPDKEKRQLALIDGNGRVAAFTGSQTAPYAGDIQGIVSDNVVYSIQGNIITSSKVLIMMENTFRDVFEKTQDLELALILSLKSGENAGGDVRGKQSAAIKVILSGEGPDHTGNNYIDLRVDDHTEPVDELIRLFKIRDKNKW